MKASTKKILIWTGSILLIGAISYVAYVGYVLYVFIGGCGMDDGPFYAQEVSDIQFSDSLQTFELSDGTLILDNRNDSLSPVLAFEMEGNFTWILDTDVSKTEGYEGTRIWEISNLTVEDGSKMDLKFTGHWTYGAEAGSMHIDKKTGKNSFCLSW